jgi:ABC-2 type transport system permease protein
MARLDAGSDTSRPIPARTQLLAVAWLRWRIFVNNFRRPRSGKSRVGALVFTILVRLLMWPILALWVIGPAVGCGFFGWMAIAHHTPEGLLPLFAGVSVAWQFLSINGVSIAATVSTFDPSSLVRFPLPFGRYLVLRTMLGLLTPSMIVGCLCLLAAAIGISVADHRLALNAFVVLAVYAWMNIFFARMLAAWLERWLATRRAREIFGVLMAFFFIGVQYFNLRRVPGHSHGVPDSRMLDLLHSSSRGLTWLPPGFAANAILLQGHPVAKVAQFAALLACTALFLAVFAIRLHKQFLGEYLSEGAARSTSAASGSRPRLVPQVPVAESSVPLSPARGVLPPTVAVCLRKEWMYLRGNASQLMGLLTPLIFVVILSRGLFAQHPRFLLPGALAYALFGSLAGLYNVFGADGAGVQVYLLAPIRLRDVVLAKNIASLLLITIQAALAWALVLIMAKSPVPASAQVSAALWIIFVIGANLTLGTLRSIQAPRRFVPGQARQMRTPTSRTSGLLVLAVLFGSVLLQVPVAFLCRHFGQPWLAAAIFAPLAACAIGAYALLLYKTEQLILSNRDLFSGELCKA